MRTLVVLGLICLFLLAACIPPADVGDTGEGATCKRISQNPRICEIRLSDGTRCVAISPFGIDGGHHITCDWQ